MYSEGWLVEKDSVEGVKWFRMAAEKGNANAQYNLGLSYFAGDGVI
ncbi:MAG: tetratricopeptide repeat protein [Rubripirellula sp.]